MTPHWARLWHAVGATLAEAAWPPAADAMMRTAIVKAGPGSAAPIGRGSRSAVPGRVVGTATLLVLPVLPRAPGSTPRAKTGRHR